MSPYCVESLLDVQEGHDSALVPVSSCSDVVEDSSKLQGGRMGAAKPKLFEAGAICVLGGGRGGVSLTAWILLRVGW